MSVPMEAVNAGILMPVMSQLDRIVPPASTKGIFFPEINVYNSERKKFENQPVFGLSPLKATFVAQCAQYPLPSVDMIVTEFENNDLFREDWMELGYPIIARELILPERGVLAKPRVEWTPDVKIPTQKELRYSYDERDIIHVDTFVDDWKSIGRRINDVLADAGLLSAEVAEKFRKEPNRSYPVPKETKMPEAALFCEITGEGLTLRRAGPRGATGDDPFAPDFHPSYVLALSVK